MLNDQSEGLIRRQLINYLLIAILAYITGYFWVVMALVLAVHLAWSTWQMQRLSAWLEDFDAGDPPQAPAGWGALFDQLWHMRRHQRAEANRLQKNLRRVERTVQNLSDGLVIISRQGEIQWWNDSAGKMLGLKPSDEGQALTNLIRSPAFSHWFRTNQEHSEFEYKHPRTGSDLSFINNRHAAGNRLIMVRNITRVKKLERMREDFVANASHELRTPLTVVQGYLESFIDLGDELPVRMRRGMHQMLAQTRRMSNLVKDLLLLTRLDSADTPEGLHGTVDVADLLRGVVEDGRALATDEDQTIELHLLTMQTVQGHRDELRSAFSNLVVNAVNYTPEGGHIDVTWKCVENELQCIVADNGIGIEPQHIPRLTERFYRADPSRSSATGGTGLGLAIVKHALAHHGARLEIKSSVGQGSQFICIFPQERP